MAQVTEAIFTGGVLKPLGELSLHESQRVRLIVEPVNAEADRAEALERFRKGVARMNFHAPEKLPSRDELHDRV